MNSPFEKKDSPDSGSPAAPATTPAPVKRYQPTWDERLEDLRDHLGPVAAVVIIFLMGGGVAWYYYKESPATPPPPAVAPLSETRSPEVAANLDDEARLATYDRLIEQETAAMRAQRGNDAGQTARLRRLEQERGELRARALGARSQQAEADAVSAETAGTQTEAASKWTEALKLHREASASRLRVVVEDSVREARLAARVDDARATDLHRTVERSRERAERAEQTEQWTEASLAYAEWRTAQATINQQMPASRFADARALARIDTALASLKTGETAAAIRRHEREAETAESRGALGAAAAAIQAALKAQQSINTSFPSSRHASAERAQALEVRWQTLASAEPFGRAARLADEAASLLREQQCLAGGEKVAAALSLFQETAASYPQSRRFDPVLRRRLVFLDLRRSEIAGLQPQALAALVPISGLPAVRMFATEVPQRLYEKVMNHNPSHQRGPQLPVECVSWGEAAAFCERLGWLLGRPVRLPEATEFRAAATRQQGAPQPRAAAGTHSRPVDRAGREPGMFSDLNANVAEWLASAEPSTAPVAGGSYLTPDAGPELSIRMESKARRAPQIGFRFVVE